MLSDNFHYTEQFSDNSIQKQISSTVVKKDIYEGKSYRDLKHGWKEVNNNYSFSLFKYWKFIW